MNYIDTFRIVFVILRPSTHKIMKNNISLLLLFLCSNLSVSAIDITEKKAFAQLDDAFAHQQYYMDIKTAHLDSLKLALNDKSLSTNKRYQLNYELGSEYALFVTDSALKYYDRSLEYARRLSDTDYKDKVQIAIARVLAISGLYKEASSYFNEIDRQQLSTTLLPEYYNCGRQIYSYLTTFVHNDIYSTQYRMKEQSYRDSLLAVLPHGSLNYQLYMAEQYTNNGNYIKAKDLLEELIETESSNSNLYARSAFNLALVYRHFGDNNKYAAYLALSALADVKASVKENAALQYLALYLYDKGDLKRAYRYIKYSLDDAIFCNARLRTLEISAIMPVIDAAYQDKLESQRKQLIIYLAIVSFLSLLLIVSLFWIKRQMKKLSVAKRNLRRANHIKEEYIGHFLNLCSLYIEKLDSFRRTVNRKITAGQIDDLLRITKSTNYAGMEQKEFYANFDNAFLELYPNFVDEFNQLLQPDERFILKSGELLNTEMRIYAIIRLGIDDSNKIANFLHYSINTIYTYRNKVKNKAIDRDNFENNILKIDSSD